MNTRYKYKKISAVFIFALLLVLMLTICVSAKNNIALECKIDSVCGGTAEMLVDKDENYSTKWHAEDGANHAGESHWIILDFETEKTFDSIRLVKASQGAEDFGRDELNAGGFGFEISSDKENWVEIFEVADDGNDICDGYFFPVTTRYLKLIVTNPEQDENSNENQAVRLYDLKVFEYIPPTEEESVEENSDIEETSDLSTVITVPPKTSDSLLFILAVLLLTGISAGIIIRIFSSRRTR